jgi:hypothetical protein
MEVLNCGCVTYNSSISLSRSYQNSSVAKVPGAYRDLVSFAAPADYLWQTASLIAKG